MIDSYLKQVGKTEEMNTAGARLSLINEEIVVAFQLTDMDFIFFLKSGSSFRLKPDGVFSIHCAEESRRIAEGIQQETKPMKTMYDVLGQLFPEEVRPEDENASKGTTKRT